MYSAGVILGLVLLIPFIAGCRYYVRAVERKYATEIQEAISSEHNRWNSYGEEAHYTLKWLKNDSVSDFDRFWYKLLRPYGRNIPEYNHNVRSTAGAYILLILAIALWPVVFGAAILIGIAVGIAYGLYHSINYITNPDTIEKAINIFKNEEKNDENA